MFDSEQGSGWSLVACGDEKTLVGSEGSMAEGCHDEETPPRCLRRDGEMRRVCVCVRAFI